MTTTTTQPALKDLVREYRVEAAEFRRMKYGRSNATATRHAMMRRQIAMTQILASVEQRGNQILADMLALENSVREQIALTLAKGEDVQPYLKDNLSYRLQMIRTYLKEN